NSSLSPLAQGLEEGLEVLDGRVALEVVYRVEDEAAPGVEKRNPLPRFSIDLVGRAEGHRFLSVHPAAPEDEVFAELTFEAGGIHLGGGALDRVEDIKSGVDEVGNELVHRTAGMNVGLPGGAPMDEA